MTKKYFKNTLKHSKHFDRVTGDVMSLFWWWEKLSGRTLLCHKFSLSCDKRLTLYSPLPSLPTFSLMFITPLNFKCWMQTGYFWMAHTTKTSNMLFVFNSLMKSCHSNKKTWFGNSHVTDDVITLDVTWEYILLQMLSCDGLTVFYV